MTKIINKLYKYFSFDPNDYWSLPLTGRLFFAKVEELRKSNDPEEFFYTMQHESSFFAPAQEIPTAFDSLFSNARVLCLGKRKSNRCWLEFCKGNGVCYEFSFRQKMVSLDLTTSSTRYVAKKITNVPEYIIDNVTNHSLRNTLKKSSRQTLEDNILAKAWLQSRQPHEILKNFIEQEVIFKKLKKFRYENEYRIIHVKTPPPDFTLTSVIDNQSSLPFKNLGLKLHKNYTSDISSVRNIYEIINKKKIQVPVVNF